MFICLLGGWFIRLNPVTSVKFMQSTALLKHSYSSTDNGERLMQHSEEKDTAPLGKGHCRFYCTAEINTSCRSAQLHALQRALPPCLFRGLSHPATVICNYGFLAEFPPRSCNFLFLFFCGTFSDFQREESVFQSTIQQPISVEEKCP